MNPGRACRELCRLAIGSSIKRCSSSDSISEHGAHLAIEIRNGILSRVAIEWPNRVWSAIFDNDGIRMRSQGNRELVLRWIDAPRAPARPDDLLHLAKYERADSLIESPLSSEGPWSMIRCPAIFAVWLWNAVIWGYADCGSDTGEPNED